MFHEKIFAAAWCRWQPWVLAHTYNISHVHIRTLSLSLIHTHLHAHARTHSDTHTHKHANAHFYQKVWWTISSIEFKLIGSKMSQKEQNESLANPGQSLSVMPWAFQVGWWSRSSFESTALYSFFLSLRSKSRHSQVTVFEVIVFF